MTAWNIAAAQSQSRPGDIDWNISHHLEFVRQAAAHHVNLLIFPELSLTGYELPLMPQLAMRTDDPRLQIFADAASEHQMSVTVGLPLIDGKNNLLCALTFQPDGTRLVYGKRNLFGDEKRFFNASKGIPLFGRQPQQVALAICADITVKEYALNAAEQGANLYATSVLISEKGYQGNSDYLARWARDYKMAVLMANHALHSGGYQSAGKSAFWDESGARIVMGGNGEQLVIARRMDKDWQGEVHSLRCSSLY